MVYGEIKANYCKNHLKYIQTGSESHRSPATNSKQTVHEADHSFTFIAEVKNHVTNPARPSIEVQEQKL
jgi:hypothetical protein